MRTTSASWVTSSSRYTSEGILRIKRPCKLDEPRAAVHAGDLHSRRQLANQVLRKRGRARQPGLECRGAFLAHQRVGIVPLRQEQEANLPSLLDLAHRVLEGAPRRRTPGAIAVETEDHFAHEPEDALQVLRRRRRAERRHRIGDAGLVQAHDVHVAFDHEQPLQVARRLPRLEEAVELAALVEQFGLRRIQVLRFALVEHAAAKGDRASARVADRKHDAVAEAVVVPALTSGRVRLPLDDEPCPQQHLPVVLGRPVAVEQAVPARRRVTDPEPLQAVCVQAASLHVVARLRLVVQ